MSIDRNESRVAEQKMNGFTDRVLPSGGDGWPMEADRYRLIINRGCPWAHRVVIARRLMGLEGIISMAETDPIRGLIGGERHWVFTERTGSSDDVDTVLGIHALRDAYLARLPTYRGGVSVPSLVDVASGKLVSNDFGQLAIDLSTMWTKLARQDGPELYPEKDRDEIDSVNSDVYQFVSRAVYQAGFASSQENYEIAVDGVFRQLDVLEERLSRQRYLVGGSITLSDLCLWPTLIRFDFVYHGLFKCNRRKLSEYPALWAYTRDLFQTPGFGDTVHFDRILQSYYGGMPDLNPSGIIPVGPEPRELLSAHGREDLVGEPFGDGSPPDRPPVSERVPAI